MHILPGRPAGKPDQMLPIRAAVPLDDCLALAGDMHAIYMSNEDSLRRIANQAFFDKLIVTDGDTIHSEPGARSTCSSPRASRPSPSATDGARQSLELKPVMSLV